MKRPKLTPHEKLVRAAQRGTGIRLTADEVWDLGGMDQSIIEAAQWAEAEREREKEAMEAAKKGKFFEKPKVRKRRPPWACFGCGHPKNDHPNDSGCERWH